MIAFIFLIFFISFTETSGCHSKCVCQYDRGLMTCRNLVNPTFTRDLQITSIQMHDGYLDKVLALVNSFPNLEYLSFFNMKYIHCEELKMISGEIVVSGDWCKTGKLK